MSQITKWKIAFGIVLVFAVSVIAILISKKENTNVNIVQEKTQTYIFTSQNPRFTINIPKNLRQTQLTKIDTEKGVLGFFSPSTAMVFEGVGGFLVVQVMNEEPTKEAKRLFTTGESFKPEKFIEKEALEKVGENSFYHTFIQDRGDSIDAVWTQIGDKYLVFMFTDTDKSENTYKVSLYRDQIISSFKKL